MVSKTKRCSPSHFAHRLKTARKMAGLSMEELAEKAGGIVTRQSISKYEKGIMRPSPHVLNQLAKAMYVDTGFFEQGERINLVSLQFRQKSRLSRKEEESIKFKTIDYLGYSHELESRLGKEKSFENPMGNVKLESISDVEEAAKKIRRKWQVGLSPIVNLLALLEEKGIKIFVTDCNEDFDGMTAKNENCHVIILNKNRPLDRLRFTASHELAHILFDFHHNIDHEEGLCHSFAGSFLLPGKVLIDLLGPNRRKISFWEWRHIKELYGISMQAAIHRAHETKIISSNYFKDLLVMLKKRGWDRIEPFEYRGKEEATRLKRLTAFALAEEILSAKEAKNLGKNFINESEFNKLIPPQKYNS